MTLQERLAHAQREAADTEALATRAEQARLEAVQRFWHLKGQIAVLEELVREQEPQHGQS